MQLHREEPSGAARAGARRRALDEDSLSLPAAPRRGDHGAPGAACPWTFGPGAAVRAAPRAAQGAAARAQQCMAGAGALEDGFRRHLDAERAQQRAGGP
eukprot:5378052-Lingulodinium_polyedra.AAC.1